MSHDLKQRAEQRAKYFEDPNFLRWSDVISRDEHSYGARTEQAFLAEYMTQDAETSGYRVRDIVKQRKNADRINWRAMYDYLDERDKTTPSWLKDEVEELHRILDSLRDELAPDVQYIAF